MKFSANLSFMFVREAPDLIQRIKLAAAAGFRGVEFAYPYDVDVSALAAAREAAGVEQVLLNSWPGCVNTGELGIAIHPPRQQEFLDKLDLSLVYLKVTFIIRHAFTQGAGWPIS